MRCYQWQPLSCYYHTTCVFVWAFGCGFCLSKSKAEPRITRPDLLCPKSSFHLVQIQKHLLSLFLLAFGQNYPYAIVHEDIGSFFSFLLSPVASSLSPLLCSTVGFLATSLCLVVSFLTTSLYLVDCQSPWRHCLCAGSAACKPVRRRERALPEVSPTVAIELRHGLPAPRVRAPAPPWMRGQAPSRTQAIAGAGPDPL